MHQQKAFFIRETWEQISIKMSTVPLLAKHLTKIKDIQISNNGAL